MVLNLFWTETFKQYESSGSIFCSERVSVRVRFYKYKIKYFFYFTIYSEVFKALNKTRGLYLRWRELNESSGAEADWTTTELRNSLRSIEWDLEDLEDTIDILFKFFFQLII